MIRHRTAVVALAAASILVLSSCSASEAPASTLSPIEEFMSAGWGKQLSPAEQKAAGDAELLAREEVIATCMSELGFEYIPHPPVPLGFNFSALGSADLDDREWITEYGYGIVFGPDSEQVVVTENPNDAIVANLTGPETLAYNQGLMGLGDAVNADGVYDPEKGGCMGAAELELSTEDPLRGDQFEPLHEAVLSFYTDLATNPAIVDLDRLWSDCMSDAGFGPYLAQLDALAEINYEYTMLVHELGSADRSDSDMVELAEREVNVALADLECREQTDYRAVYAEVRLEQEKVFVEDNRAELEAYKTFAEQTDS